MSVAIKLNKRVLLQRPVVGRDAHKQQLPGWENVIPGTKPEVFASIKDMTGRQHVAAGATQNSVQTVITIRHIEGLEAGMRAVSREQIYDIESVLGQDQITLQLMVKRGVSNG